MKKARNKSIVWICLPVLLIACFILVGEKSDTAKVKRWIVNQASSLSVNGSTNVNKFSCVIPSYDQADTLSLSKKDKEIILTGNIRLNVNSFDCHNSGMTKQLRKTLKGEQFPMLYINFLSLNNLPELNKSPALITGLVIIEIAGVSKHFKVDYQITQDAQKGIRLLGSRDVNFSDFNLVPPRKLGGMIKTNDKLSVVFDLNIKAIE
jgi:hypothetical protein